MVEETRMSRYAQYRAEIKAMPEPPFSAPEADVSPLEVETDTSKDKNVGIHSSSLSLEDVMRTHDAYVKTESKSNVTDSHSRRWKIIGIVAAAIIGFLAVIFLAALLYRLLF